MIVRKSRAEIEKMRLAGQVVADVHKMLRDLVRPGITTRELDTRAEALIRKAGALPTFKGYKVGREVFPATLCVSINHEIVHGIPSELFSNPNTEPLVPRVVGDRVNRYDYNFKTFRYVSDPL